MIIKHFKEEHLETEQGSKGKQNQINTAVQDECVELVTQHGIEDCAKLGDLTDESIKKQCEVNCPCEATFIQCHFKF